MLFLEEPTLAIIEYRGRANGALTSQQGGILLDIYFCVYE